MIICAKYPKAHIAVGGKAVFIQIVAAAVLTTNIAIYFSTIVQESKVCVVVPAMCSRHYGY